MYGKVNDDMKQWDDKHDIKEWGNYQEKYPGLSWHEARRLQLKNSVDKYEIKDVGTSDPLFTKHLADTKRELKETPTVYKDNQGKFRYYDGGSDKWVEVTPLMVGDIVSEKEKTERNTASQIVDNSGRIVYKTVAKDQYFVSKADYTLGGERKDYVTPRVYYNSKCKAADAVPTGDGNYVDVKYDQYCRPV